MAVVCVGVFQGLSRDFRSVSWVLSDAYYLIIAIRFLLFDTSFLIASIRVLPSETCYLILAM